MVGSWLGGALPAFTVPFQLWCAALDFQIIPSIRVAQNHLTMGSQPLAALVSHGGAGAILAGSSKRLKCRLRSNASL